MGDREHERHHGEEGEEGAGVVQPLLSKPTKEYHLTFSDRVHLKIRKRKPSRGTWFTFAKLTTVFLVLNVAVVGFLLYGGFSYCEGFQDSQSYLCNKLLPRDHWFFALYALGPLVIFGLIVRTELIIKSASKKEDGKAAESPEKAMLYLCNVAFFSTVVVLVMYCLFHSKTSLFATQFYCSINATNPNATCPKPTSGCLNSTCVYSFQYGFNTACRSYTITICFATAFIIFATYELRIWASPAEIVSDLWPAIARKIREDDKHNGSVGLSMNSTQTAVLYWVGNEDEIWNLVRATTDKVQYVSMQDTGKVFQVPKGISSPVVNHISVGENGMNSSKLTTKLCVILEGRDRPTEEIDFLIDTGAVMSAIPAAVLSQHYGSLLSGDEAVMQGATGREDRFDTFYCSFNDITTPFLVLETSLPHGLLGMDVLQHYNFKWKPNNDPKATLVAP